MDNLIAALAEPTRSRTPGRSIMDGWLDTRSEQEQAAIRTAAVNPEWGHVALMKQLLEYGAPELSDTAFRQWRRRQGLVG